MTDPAGAGSAAHIDLVRLTKRFGSFTAVDDLSLEIPAGAFFALLGPSGCGKTTTLRMIGGLEDPTAGQVLIGGEDMTHRKPYRRPVNTVFQSYALFPHLTIFENVAFGLRRTRAKGIPDRVSTMLDLVQLAGYGDRRPNALSGGQQQRVALARALINNPKVLLLDEPLGALDLKLRRQMQLELKRIQTEVGTTFVHVTHDQEEAMTMADTIAVMHDGVVEQLGGPIELYEKPTTAFVANFLGQSNLLLGTVVDRDGPDLVVDVRGTRLRVADAAGAEGDRVQVGVRPEKISFDGTDTGGSNHLTGTVADASFMGTSTQYLVDVPWGQQVTVFTQNLGHDADRRPGQDVTIRWRPEHTFCVPPDAGDAVAADGSPGPAAEMPNEPTPGAVASTLTESPGMTARP